MKWSTLSLSTPTGGCWPAPATTALSWPSMAAAFSRNSLRLAPRKSPALPATPEAKSSSAPRIPEKFFLSARNTSRKARTNPALLTPSFFRSGAAWIGGVLRPRCPLNPWHLPANRAWNFSCAPATPKTPAKNGRAGLVPIRNLAPAPNPPPPASRSGKPSFTTAAPATASTGSASRISRATSPRSSMPSPSKNPAFAPRATTSFRLDNSPA